MSAFISYSQKDIAAHSTLSLALEGQHINYWDPKSMEAGASLRDQLRGAINRCDVCIFLATRSSIESKWCSAEIGAFWGAGKKVIVFISDPEITEEQIPPQFQGDLWTRDVREVIRNVQATIITADEMRRKEAARRPRLVSEMTVATLYDVLTSLRNHSGGALSLSDVMRSIQENNSANLADSEALVRPLVNSLIGVPNEIIQTTASKYWKVSFSLSTETGEWVGFAKELINQRLFDGYANCLLLLCDSRQCVAAATATVILEREKRIECEGLIASTDRSPVGEIKKLSGAPPEAPIT